MYALTYCYYKIHAGIHSIKFRNQFSIPQLKLIAGTEFDELNLFPALNLLSMIVFILSYFMPLKLASVFAIHSFRLI